MTKEKMRIMTILSFLVIGSVLVGRTVLAQSSSSKPGWGNGDKNHVHTGPPGESVRPEKDDNHGQVADNSHETRSGGPTNEE